MFRRISPFFFTGLSLLICNTQGLPGDGGGGGGSPTPPANAPPPPNGGGEPSGAPAPPQPRTEHGRFDSDPAWLPGRIKQAKESAQRELLQTLGVTDPEQAKKLLEEGKKSADAQKTELERRDERIKALEPAVAERDQYRAALEKRAEAELGTLPAAAQEKIKAMFGDKPDPLKVLEAVDLARTMGATTTPAAGAPAQGQQGQGQPGQPAGAPAQGRPPAAPPASTTGTPGGPPSATGSPPDHLAIWQDLKTKNPMVAGQYLLAHQQEIVEAQQAKNK